MKEKSVFDKDLYLNNSELYACKAYALGVYKEKSVLACGKFLMEITLRPMHPHINYARDDRYLYKISIKHLKEEENKTRYVTVKNCFYATRSGELVINKLRAILCAYDLVEDYDGLENTYISERKMKLKKDIYNYIIKGNKELDANLNRHYNKIRFLYDVSVDIFGEKTLEKRLEVGKEYCEKYYKPHFEQKLKVYNALTLATLRNKICEKIAMTLDNLEERSYHRSEEREDKKFEKQYEKQMRKSQDL